MSGSSKLKLLAKTHLKIVTREAHVDIMAYMTGNIQEILSSSSCSTLVSSV